MDDSAPRHRSGPHGTGCGGEKVSAGPNAEHIMLAVAPPQTHSYALVDGHTDRDVHKDRNRVRNSMLAAWECGACTLAQSGAAVGCVRYAMGWRPSALRSALMSARHARLSM